MAWTSHERGRTSRHTFRIHNTSGENKDFNSAVLMTYCEVTAEYCAFA